MKPAFALDFRHEMIRLLHRTSGGWQIVGQVALDAPDLPEALGYLRSTALGLSPRGIATKLIIPNDQVLYTVVDTGGTDVATRYARIEAGLEGRTPYAIDDLVYDARGIGPQVQVAVVARETLAEAEGFAAEHRFNPVSFVAVPEDDDFDGEVWFGPTALSTSLLARGEAVERDAEPVMVTQRSVAVAEAEAAPAAEVVEVADAAAVAAETAPSQAETALESEPAWVDAEPATGDAPPAEAETPSVAAWTAPDDLPAVAEIAAEPVAAEPSRQAFDLEDSSFAAEPEPIPAPAPLERSKPAARAKPAPLIEVEEAPMALDVPLEPEVEAAPPEPARAEPIRPLVSDPGAKDPAQPTVQHARVTDPGIDDDLPEAPSLAVIAAFSSRRQSDATPKPLPAAGAAIAAPAPRAAAPAAKAGAAKPVVAKPLKGTSAPVTAPGIAGGKPRHKVTIPSAMQPLPEAEAPLAAATAAARSKPPARNGGLGSRTVPVRGKPRYLGLILTAVLLFLLVMVAAWSSYSLAFWQGDEEPAVETVQGDPADSAVPDIADEMAADMQDPADLAADETEGEAEALAATDSGEDAQAPAEIASPDAADTGSTEVATEEAAAPAPVATAEVAAEAGSTAQSAPSADTQNEIYLATADAPPPSTDPLALREPAAMVGDALPAAQAPPPPFGTVYQFDAKGVIQPTPEGIITPDGVLLTAGKPPRVPADRPAGLTVAMAEPAAPQAEADVTEPAELPVDPALAGKKPLPRPADLVPAVQPDPALTPDQGALAPAQDSRFADLRPKARPAAVLAAGEAARLASANASLAAPADEDVSVLAVSISRRPAARPDGIARATELAFAAAAQEPVAKASEPEPQPVPVAEPAKAAAKPAKAAKAAEPEKEAAPEADGEPEVASTNPKIPTKAAVAKQATFKNAINLSTVNLIGVYGTNANRYAMVRMGNGSYKKVKVGDRLDGGKVAAITASEVRYQKGGRLVTLAMPKS